MSSKVHSWGVHPFCFLHPHKPSHLLLLLSRQSAPEPWGSSHATCGGTDRWSVFCSHPLKMCGFRPALKGLGSQMLCIWPDLGNLSCTQTAPGILFPPQSESHWRWQERYEQEEKTKRQNLGNGQLEESQRLRADHRMTFQQKNMISLQFNSVHCLKTMIHCLKWWTWGGKERENEWINKWGNSLNYCTWTMFFHFRPQAINWRDH